MTQSIFIGHPIYQRSTYGLGHPLAIPRVSLATDLARAMGWLKEENYHLSRQATIDELSDFHDLDYIRALMKAEQTPPSQLDQAQYNIGINGNPLFREIFQRPATACGGGLMAADFLISGKARSVFNIAGGQHHGLADKASGFCYLNEPVLTIRRLLTSGAKRVFYLDLDAHFGDGTQLAFHDEERVFTLSIHEQGRWPLSRDSKPGDAGTVEDCAGGMARNLPVPSGLNDSEFDYLIEMVAMPLILEFAPDVIYLQCGCDALADDPQSKLELSNRAIWKAVEAVKQLAVPLLVSGGGGYNPYSVARCWAGVWAHLCDLEITDALEPEAEAILRAVNWQHRKGRTPPETWLSSIADMPNEGPIRDEIYRLAEKCLQN